MTSTITTSSRTWKAFKTHYLTAISAGALALAAAAGAFIDSNRNTDDFSQNASSKVAAIEEAVDPPVASGGMEATIQGIVGDLVAAPVRDTSPSGGSVKLHLYYFVDSEQKAMQIRALPREEGVSRRILVVDTPEFATGLRDIEHKDEWAIPVEVIDLRSQ